MLEERLFWNFLNSYDYIIKCLALGALLNYTYDRKSNNLTLALSFLLLTQSIYNIRFSNIYGMLIILSIIISCVYCKINYNISNNKILVLCVTYWILVEELLHYITSKLIPINSINNINSYIYHIQYNIALTILLIIIFVLMKYFANRKKYNDTTLKLIFIPVFVNLILLIVVFDNINRTIKSKNMHEIIDSKNITMLIIAILLIISTIYISYVFDKIAKSHKLEIENNIIKRNINKDYNYYLSLKDQQIKVRKLHHDMKNHLICIKEMYKDGNSKMNLYIDNLEVMISEYKEAFETNNSILNIIINDMYNKAINENIDYKCYIDFSKCDFIEMVDVCTIFSNCLDNAFEACMKINNSSIDKYIKIKSMYINNMCVIKIENSKINNVFIKNEQLVSDKSNNLLHGFGTKNIKDTLEKYNSEVVFQDEKYKFTVKIVIPLKS